MLTPTERAEQVVHLADADQSFRTATCHQLEAAGFQTRQHPTATDFLDSHTAPPRGCLVLDIRFPTGISGPDLQQELNRRHAILPLIFLTGHGDIPTSVKVLKGGAHDFLTKPADISSLLQAVTTALAKEQALWDSRQKYKDRLENLLNLTATEREIFLRMVDGISYERICRELGIPRATVSTHRSGIMRKMKATTLAQLVHQTHQLRVSMGKESFPTVRSLFEIEEL
ncbi:response regulator transcription factor [Luteolibacter yonseiensis]|uniref:Response regulator transcription factor n=1 Tax=Luteolibacter yonseiensis TaxID=1144680 RepID=A0A934QYM7_9BACT|nr:response regulator [Luteolibacter yonseiensis]MBK1815118.1 response regulator transcription factor [Luteolibacter yonseiensis]